ncbi:MAG: hypothetical protein JWR85_717, partial [Marmoricola sp.]|nr:hypothetical protein [Marmoricola sp.]
MAGPARPGAHGSRTETGCPDGA